jgi:hypothetical protein
VRDENRGFWHAESRKRNRLRSPFSVMLREGVDEGQSVSAAGRPIVPSVAAFMMPTQSRGAA